MYLILGNVMPANWNFGIEELKRVKLSFSKSEIDRLGDRFRKGSYDESDVKKLYDYKKSFQKAYETTVAFIRNRIQLEPTGRSAKSTNSIVEKLLRESIRLSQMQDITGCRIVISGIAEQDEVVSVLIKNFSQAIVIDRRFKPSNGYRAVHVILESDDKFVEIQVRTTLQHLWAEYSEKLSDVFDHSIKYGGGEKNIQNLLFKLSEIVTDYEKIEGKLIELVNNEVDIDFHGEVEKLKEQIRTDREKIADSLREEILQLDKRS